MQKFSDSIPSQVHSYSSSDFAGDGGFLSSPVYDFDLRTLIDWCQGSFSSVNLQDVCDCICSFIGGEFVQRDNGTKNYENSMQHSSGIIIAWEPRNRCFFSVTSGCESPRDAYLEFTGSILGKIEGVKQFELFTALNSLGFRASRLDLTLDIYNYGDFCIADVKRAYDRRHYRGFRDTGVFYEAGRSGRKGASMEFGYRGKHGSGKRLQFYDKSKESGGVFDCLRCELSLYSKYCHDAWASLLEDFDLWPDLIKGWIDWAIDFRDRVKSRFAHCERLGWWAAIMDGVARMYPKPLDDKPPAIERLTRWFYKQVAPSIATYCDYLNQLSDSHWSDFLESLLFSGRKRRSPELDELLERAIFEYYYDYDVVDVELSF